MHLFPSSPRHALLAVAISAAGFVGPWIVGSWRAPTPAISVSATLPAQRVVHVVMPEQNLDHNPKATEIAPKPQPAADDSVSTDPDPGEHTGDEGRTLMAIASGPGPVLHGEVALVRGTALVDGRKGRKARKPGRKRHKRTRQECLPEREDIAKVNDLAYRVEDATVYFYANHPREAEALAATWWSRDDEDEIQGFKVGRIRCGAFLDQLGFENGDVISQINGLEIKTYGDAVNAYMTLRRKRILWVTVTRHDEPVRLDYVLVGEGEIGQELEEDDPLNDPSALVDAELEAAELPWLRRAVARRRLRRVTR